MYDDDGDAVMMMALGDPDYPQGSRAECEVCGGEVFRDVLLPLELRHRDEVEVPHTPEVAGAVAPKVTVTTSPDGSVTVMPEHGIQIQRVQGPHTEEDGSGPPVPPHRLRWEAAGRGGPIGTSDEGTATLLVDGVAVVGVDLTAGSVITWPDGETAHRVASFPAPSEPSGQPENGNGA